MGMLEADWMVGPTALVYWLGGAKLSDTDAVSVVADCHVIHTTIKSVAPVVEKAGNGQVSFPVVVFVAPEQVQLKVLRC